MGVTIKTICLSLRRCYISVEVQINHADGIDAVVVLFLSICKPPLPSTTSHRQKRMMGMTQNEKELIDVESHYPTDRIPMEMKEKSVAENLLDKMSEAQ